LSTEKWLKSAAKE